MKKTSEPTQGQKEKFYADVIQHLNDSKIPYLLGGTYAVIEYTGIKRDTKDIDFFCKSGDYPKILSYMKEKGFETWVEDERFVAKISKGELYADLILGSFNSFAFVDDTWFENAPKAKFLGKDVRLITPEDLIWSKIYVKNRYRYHGADINHLILRQGNKINWKRLLNRMEQHWEVLFSTILNFRFVYPSERGIIPIWLMEELVSRLKHQLEIPIPLKKICRGRLFSANAEKEREYEIDFKEWGFEDTFIFGESITK